MSEAIVIDPEFKALIPPLSDEERSQLRENIERDGAIFEPVVRWKGHRLCLDGHNRLEISRELSMGYDIRDIDLPDRQAAIEWIILHQFGRRNLSAMVRGELALKLKPIVAAKAEEREKSGKSQENNPGENFPQGQRAPKTNETVAAAAGLSDKTIAKVETIAKKGTPALQQAARANKISIDAAAKATELPAEQQDEIAKSSSKKESAKALKEAVAAAETKESEAPSDPRESYNEALLAEADVIEGVARRLTKLAEFDKGHNPKNEFAKGHLHHAATVGALRQVKRTLEECQIVDKRGDRYINKREADHTARVATARRGAA